MILITGSTGFVGMNLLKKLSKGNSKIIALYRSEQKKRLVEKFLKSSKSTNKNIIWKKSTINDIISLEEAFAGVTKVYHCAGYISFSANEKKKLNSVNINGTKNIVNLCIDKKILKLIYFSSISALGDELNENRINENTNYTNFHQQTPYSYSKYNAELEVWRGIQEGLKSVIINPGIILGKSVRNDAPQSKIEKMILKYPFCFYAKGKSGFVYIDDVISASLKLMNSSISNERFILVSNNYSYKLILNKLMINLRVNKKLIGINKCVFNFMLNIDFILSIIGFKKRFLSFNLIKSLFNQKEYDGSKITRFLPNFNYKNV